MFPIVEVNTSPVDCQDLVRAEIATTLERGVSVIRVLVQDAEMPISDDLPDDIRVLAHLNGISLNRTHWHAAVERLIKELDR